MNRTFKPSGSKIIELRMERGWSQDRLIDEIDALARNDNKIGRIDKRTLQRIEKGEKCYLSSLHSIAKVFGRVVPDLIHTIETPSPSNAEVLPKASTSSSGPINLAVLLSGNLSYTRDISRGFVDTLKRYGSGSIQRLEFFEVAGPKEPLLKSQTEDVWTNLCRLLHRRNRAGYDYYVTIGTQASISLSRYLNHAFGEKPFLFLGVTDPITTGLVASLNDRDEGMQIGGIAYGPGIGKIASQVCKLFPNQQLIFIYCEGFPQDTSAAQLLRSTRLYLEGRLKIVQTKGLPTLSDLVDPDAIYFSWYTFESMYEDDSGEGVDILSQRLVVATTRGNVQPPGLAVAGVGANDEEIGKYGAELIVKHLEGEITSFGRTEIAIPKCRYWLNLTTAKERGVEFNQMIIQDASEIFR